MKPSEDNLSLGLVAVGSAGGWEVDLDEATLGDARWFMLQIEGPTVYMNFEVESPGIIERIVEFVNERHIAGSKSNELMIGKSKGQSVTLMRDDEFTDRFFLVVQTDTELTVRVTIGGNDLNQLENALRQAKEDVDNEGAE
jgi:hypothetical protein